VKRLTEAQLARLQPFGFDPELFARWRSAVRDGSMSKEANAARGELRPPPPGAIQKPPDADSRRGRELVELGARAIGRGELGVVVLNGGMATRFGGRVKGVVRALEPDRSFLGLVAEDLRAAEARHGGRVRLYLMNSFATDAATKAHLAEHRHFGLDPAQVHHFTQFISVRMRPDGELFFDQAGEVSPYGPGHGDFAPAFRHSGCLQRFLQDGGRWLLVRNVDNVGARIDAGILGLHIDSGRDMTVEVAPKWPGDVGGAPFVLDGRLQLVEQLRYPKGFTGEDATVFNTNTFTFTAAALDRDFDLGWYFVSKQVDGRPAVQVERLIGELSRFLDSNYLQVRRSGTDNRFLPVKTPEDLEAARDEIAAMYGERAG
jgi:UTP--glucose-1-phosphate uridylyltransferase